MIILTASKSCLTASRRELLVEGAVNVNIVQFVFSSDWDGLTKTAVFQAGSDKYSVLLDESNETPIPWEVLQNPRRTLYAGVYGTVGGDLVLPTIWASLGTIQEGATPGQDTQPPTPTVYEQLLADIGNLDDLDTRSKDSLVAAINEVYTTGGGGIKLLSIAVTTPPNKTEYRPGDVFDPAGMVVTASYEFGLEQAVTGYTYTPSGALAEGNTQITISYSEGGVTAQTTQAITVEKATVQVPSQSGALTYTGEAQSPTWDNYNQADMTLSGETSGTNAGSYDAVFTLTNTVGTQWPDGTTEPKTVAWSIQKATGQVTLNPESLTLTADQTSGTVTVTRLGTGAVTAQATDTSVASAQVSGDQVTVTGLETGTTTVTVSAADDGNYTAGSASLSVQVQFSEIYGVEWDGTGTTVWSRTDAAELFTDPEPAVNNGTGSSPFDDIMPWSGMVTSEDPEAGTLVAIPKFWYKWTRSGNGMKLQISNGPEDGFLVSPAHADRGDGYGERDVIYVGRYHCGSSYKSQTGVQPVTNITRSTARVSIHALGADIYQWDWATRWTIMMLYLVEYANWNSQAAIGYGCSPSSKKFNMGLTDAMQYHTGTSAASRTTYGCCQYRRIEGLWDNVYDWVDGIYFSGANVYCILNPDDYSDTTGGTLVGQRATNSGWISAWTDPSAVDGYEWALYPDAVNGSQSTFVTDYCSYNASGVVLLVGGFYSQGQDRGLFCAAGYGAASYSSSGVGSRLHKLPKGEGV